MLKKRETKTLTTGFTFWLCTTRRQQVDAVHVGTQKNDRSTYIALPEAIIENT